MSTLVRNALILLACLAISLWAVIPPEKNLRRGKDLAGGVSLIYGVNIKRTDAPDTLAKVSQNVKERLDPNGILEISVVPQGSDRLEITMPLPSDKVKALQQNFEDELKKVATSTLTRDELERIARISSAEERAKQLREKLGANAEPARVAKLEKAATDFIAARQARDIAVAAKKELDALNDRFRNTGGETAPDAEDQKRTIAAADVQFATLRTAAALAENTYESSLKDALAVGLNPGELRRALTLSEKPLRLRGKDNKVAELDSPRKRAIDEIYKNFPDQKVAIDNVITAWNKYQSERRSLDDPQDVIRILKGAGVLNFRITVNPGELQNEAELRDQLRTGGPKAVKFDEAHFYKVNKVEAWVDSVESLEALKTSPSTYFLQRNLVAEEYKGEYYILCWDKRGLRLTEQDGEWAVARAFPGTDQLGRAAIDFQMDALGSDKLGELTGRNQQRNMAVLLDDQVYTAPVLQSRISSQGQISGTFSQTELEYIVRVLSAGSMKAKLTADPISRSILGPSLGAENLRQGFLAAVIAFFATGVFMIVYYFMYGLIAMVALLFNALLIVAAMSLNQAAFTLPGIAGIILTFGQAVDANVLVYERMREEFNRGHDMRTAVRLGFHRAMSAIVDGNVTSLIVCVVLGFTGTQEIRGFALTLGIGTVTTLFAQLFFSRFVFTVLVDHLNFRRASMLPMVNNNWLGSRLIPKIDWMGMRHVSYVISILLTGVGVFFLISEGRNLLGTEFRGGTSATLVLKADESGQQMTMTRPEVADRVTALAEKPGLENFKFAEIVAVNPSADGITTDTFTVKTLITDAPAVQSALVGAFADKLDINPALTFVDSGVRPEQAPVFPVSSSTLGNVIDRSGLTQDVSFFENGAAIVLENIQPAVSLNKLRERLATFRAKPENAEISNRAWDVVLLDGSEQAVKSAVVLVRDPEVRVDERSRWDNELREREWSLVRAALTEAQALSEVQSFSPAVAKTFQAQAWVATILSTLLIVIYIWIRFTSFRYSMAAIVTTLHDCLVAIGFVALATVLYNSPSTQGIAGALGILPFKIDLNVVAAILTTLGYSLNDTIIIMDRIRENRGKLPYASRQIINDSINQTISRTLITSGTTFIAVMTLYIFGGEGVRVFAYTMLIGLIVGTYSSIAVAAPLVWSHKAEDRDRSKTGQSPEAGAKAA